LAVDENAVTVEIAPGPRVGEPGTARVAGGAAGTLRIEGTPRTVPRQRHGKGTVDFQPLWGSPVILVRGEYPISEPPYRIEVAVPDPDRQTGEALAAELRREGIDVAGGVRVSLRAVSGAGPVLAAVESPPLAVLLEPILTDSSNWIAEMLLRLVAAEVLGEGRDDEGLELERELLEETVGLAPESFRLDDASGLSPYNLLAPAAAVELLRWVWRQPWRRHFVDALARPGRGTLDAWSGLPPVAAKTGMIRDTVALAGYLQPSAAEPVTFACFLNHRPGDRGVLRAEIAALLRRW
jgi:D-alanyl-D-alanine carboxypeptidase/D-alanyl-D-alanine-endopeptidase (penicillin-binding protein 4)